MNIGKHYKDANIIHKSKCETIIKCSGARTIYIWFVKYNSLAFSKFGIIYMNRFMLLFFKHMQSSILGFHCYVFNYSPTVS